MTQQPPRYHTPPATRRLHRAYQDHVLKELPLLRLDIVPSARVHPLPQQLNRRLSTVNLVHRHVQVIDENHDELFPVLWAVMPLPSPHVHLILNRLLHLRCCRLTAQRRSQVRVNLVKVLRTQLVLYVHRLPGPRRTAEQVVDLVLHPEVHENVVPDRLVRRDEQLMVRYSFSQLEIFLAL